MIRVRVWIECEGECVIEFQDYSEASATSMVMVECQATSHYYGWGYGFGKVYGEDKVMVRVRILL